MDLIAHALYGATVCSKKGLAGKRDGSSARHWYLDKTVWWAILFGLLPDMLSMWIPFAVYTITGPQEHFFRYFGGPWLTVYRVVHSLVCAAAVSGILYKVRRPLFVPSLAWMLHVLMDAISHGVGKYQTLLFYPFSTWGIDGIPWWRSPWLLPMSWLLLPVIWMALWWWRRRWRKT
ncbi:MAG: hypothetical protein EOM20_08740 [Spartobacteria bacterium]|nr:hypothetical protein [Spartobacteria bacterium]